MRISKIADDWVVKRLHVHVGKVELMVRPGQGGTIVLKSVFSSTPAQDVDAAIRLVQAEMTKVVFRQQLHRVAVRGVEYLRRCGLPGAAAKSGELRFLVIALKKLGLV